MIPTERGFAISIDLLRLDLSALQTVLPFFAAENDVFDHLDDRASKVVR